FQSALPQPVPTRPRKKKPIMRDPQVDPDIVVEIQEIRPRLKPPDPEPFAPTGLAVGRFLVKPYIAIGAGFDSNPYDAQIGAQGSATLNGAVGADYASQWFNHSVSGALNLQTTRYLKFSDLDEVIGSSYTDFRLDLTKRTALNFQMRGNVDTQSLNSPETQNN